MEAKLFFLIVFIINLAITVKTYNIVEDEDSGNTESAITTANRGSNVRSDFQNLFESIAKNDITRGRIYREILKKDTAREQQLFDKMKEELWQASRKKNIKKEENINKKTNINVHGVVSKRETDDENDHSAWKESTMKKILDQTFQSKTRTRRGIYRDFNHPANLVHLHYLQEMYCDWDDNVNKRVEECKTIPNALIPEETDNKYLDLFYHDYGAWWLIFKYSKSEFIRDLKVQIENFTKVDTGEEKAALVSRLHSELIKIAEKRIVYDKKVVVNESNTESVVNAFKEWGMHDERLLNVARALHRVWVAHSNPGRYNEVWPRKVISSRSS